VLINATAIPTDKVLRPFQAGLEQYGDACTFLQGKATDLNPKDRTVTVDVVGGTTKYLKYDSLFICTGTTSASPLWTLHDDEDASLREFKRMHEVLPKVKTVLIAGAGAVGVETAGEIAAAYPDIKITLVAGKDVLDKLKPSLTTKAKGILKAANVKVLTGVRVDDTSSSASGTKVNLSDGSSETVELYIDARGASKVNSDFLPRSWLDGSGRVLTRDEYFRVKGDGSSDVEAIYVLGDIVAGSNNTGMELDAMVPVAGTAFAVDVIAKSGGNNKPAGGVLRWIPGFAPRGITQKPYKPMKDTMVVPIGPDNGVGQIMGWSVPSLMVKKVKGESFLIQNIEPTVLGTKYAQL
jgi:NADH dehydrogenase FAD-containing subunit